MQLRTCSLIVAALAVAAIARAEPGARTNVVRVEHRPADQNPSLGPPGAPVTAELFFVPGQVESNRAYRRLVELQARHPHRLRVVFRVITRQAQVVVPIAALEAFGQGKFDQFMGVVLAAKTGAVRREQLGDLAAAAGMDPVRLDRALERALDPDLLPEPLRANERRRLRRGGANVPELLFNAVPVGQTLAALDVEELERYYDAAYQDASLMLADGVPLHRLLDAAERATAPRWAAGPYPAGPIDDPEPGVTLGDGAPPLLERALDLTGLPSVGAVDAPVEVVVLCNLRYVSCRQQLESVARRVHDLYPDEVRLTWAPWFDVSVEGNEAAPRLHTAALCAERQGAGWKWIDETLRQVMRGAGEGSAEDLIDAVADLAEVDRQALGECLAATDDALVRARVRDAIEAGVHRGPALVVGGRVYAGGFTDWRAVTPLVEAELAPGLLERLVPSWDRVANPRLR